MPVPVYVFKVELMHYDDIWRRIAIPANKTLDDLHYAIFVAFDRDDNHLYSFYFPRRHTKSLPTDRNSVEYVHPSVAEEEGDWPGAPMNAAKAKLQLLKLRPRRVFYYLFDYGDMWWHKITVGSINAPAPEKTKQPWILERHGESPPQYPIFDE